MSVTYVLRHGRTAMSAAYLVNSDPTVPVPLDRVGIEQCERCAAAEASWLDTVRVCVTSQFARTQDTADRLLGGRDAVRLVEPRLDEIDYGSFEGGPWMAYGEWLRRFGPTAVPPASAESWVAAVRRLLDGVATCLDYQGPRLVVGHGLLVSVLRALRDPAHGPIDGSSLPEARYLDPVAISDADLRTLVCGDRRIRAFE